MTKDNREQSPSQSSPSHSSPLPTPSSEGSQFEQAPVSMPVSMPIPGDGVPFSKSDGEQS